MYKIECNTSISTYSLHTLYNGSTLYAHTARHN